MRDRDDRPLILLKMLLEPLDRFRVQMIGRLIEQQDVRLLDQQAAQGHASPLTAREHGYFRVGRGASQRIHRHFQLALELPTVHGFNLLLQLSLLRQQLIHLLRAEWAAELQTDRLVLAQHRDDILPPLFHDLLDGLVLVELRLLFQQSHGIPFGECDLSEVILVRARNDAKQRALAGAVRAQYADLRAIIEGEIDVLEDLTLWRVHASHADERKNDCLSLTAIGSSRN